MDGRHPDTLPGERLPVPPRRSGQVLEQDPARVPGGTHGSGRAEEPEDRRRLGAREPRVPTLLWCPGHPLPALACRGGMRTVLYIAAIWVLLDVLLVWCWWKLHER